MKRINLSIDENLYENIEYISRSNNISMANVTRVALDLIFNEWRRGGIDYIDTYYKTNKKRFSDGR